MVKIKRIKMVIFVVLLAAFLFVPSANAMTLYRHMTEFAASANTLKELRAEEETSKKNAVEAHNKYESYRTSEIDPSDPVAITKTFRGLDGITLTAVNALTLNPVPTVIGTYDENANQWCEGLELTMKAESVEDTLLRIEKMQLTLISVTVKTPNTITVQINIKGVN